jgi:hypothetical protein
MAKKIDKGFLSIGTKDVVKGAIVSFLTVVTTWLGALLETGVMPTTWDAWRHQLLIGLGAGLAYIIKNLFTNENDEFLKK